MVACSKVGDTETALKIIKQVGDNPSEHIFSNFFYTVASTESFKQQYIKSRQYRSQIEAKDLIDCAKEIFEKLKKLKLSNNRVLSAYLACMTNHRDRLESERIFYHLMSVHHEDDYEHMLKLYDSEQDCVAMEHLLQVADKENIKLSKLSLRAVARIFSHGKKYLESVNTVRMMKDEGMKPTFNEFKTVYYQLCQDDQSNLKAEMKLILAPSVQPCNNPFIPWRDRSKKIYNLLHRLYGPNAPKLATKDKSDRTDHCIHE